METKHLVLIKPEIFTRFGPFNGHKKALSIGGMGSPAARVTPVYYCKGLEAFFVNHLFYVSRLPIPLPAKPVFVHYHKTSCYLWCISCTPTCIPNLPF